MKDLNVEHLFLPAITKKPYASLNLPGSKSIANRILLLAALAEGESIIHNIPDVAHDIIIMQNALKILGINIYRIDNLNTDTTENATYRIQGCAGKFPQRTAYILCGNSGTSLRFLSAALAMMHGNYFVTGITRMEERPITDLINALRQIGAIVSYPKTIGYPPLHILPFCDNHCPSVNIRGNTSSQYLSGLLIASSILKRDLKIRVIGTLISKPYVDITLALLNLFSCDIVQQNEYYYIKGNNPLKPVSEYTVEPDATSASYFLAMAAISGHITINNLSKNSLQGDKNFAEVLAQMGAKVIYHENAIVVESSGQLNAITINMQDMPDVAMTLAVLALFAHGTTTISGISSWKIKETNRIIAMHNELSKLGALVSYDDNSITITPPQAIKQNIAIDTYNDHRMAMCFSLLPVAGIPVTINNFRTVEKTFANYFDLFQELCYYQK